MSRFVHLHVHSHYSLLDGLGKIDELIARAKELDMPALALTDHGNMYGAIEFYTKCKKAGIKAIIGVESYLSPRGMLDKVPKIDSTAYHQLLLAKDETGYKNLLYLVSEAHTKGMYYKPRIDVPLLAKNSKGLIATSSCLAGMIPEAIMANDMEKAITLTKQFTDMFEGDFYLEMQHHPSLEKQMRVNEGLKAIAKELSLPLIATSDIHYVRKEDKDTHEVLLAINTGKDLNSDDRMSLADVDLYMHDEAFFRQAFPDHPEIIENTAAIAEKCDLKLKLGESILPIFDVPDGYDENTYLEHLCREGLTYRYGAPPYADYIEERLRYELDTIKKMGFSSYHLIVGDFINWAKNQGIYVGPGRGSAAGSLVAYLTGITDLDPFPYGFLFERYLNPDRISMPDIDTDFADDDRDKVIEYVRKKYGEENVAGIATFGTMMGRAAVRDVGRVLGMTYAEVDEIAKLVPPPVQGKHIPLKTSIENVPELKARYEADPRIRKLLDFAKKLEGTVRHASQHACGFVICQDAAYNYTPVQPAQRGREGLITQYSLKPVEEVGLLKMDFLGLSNLTIMRNAIRVIRKVYGAEIDIHNLALDDKKTYELLSRGETTGVFQFECLSGDTIISNTTLKKLYERQHKHTLESVYLDEGKVHKNAIEGIYKSGKKPVYALVAENGWFIKATKDHSFLTETGWKTLGELRVGERVLLKNTAKHVIFNRCESCPKVIDGQKEGKSRFCYACSARYYKNPSKQASRQKIAKSRIQFYQAGERNWNDGLTKETSQVLAQTGKKIGQALQGRTWEELHGPQKAAEFREMHSRIMKGESNHMFGKPSPHRKGGYREDLGHYVRSSWEADFARILKLHTIEYQYEPQRFALTRSDGEVVHYTPDFFVPSENRFYEIKGWMHDLDAEKIRLFQEQYPQYHFTLISATRFAEFALKYRDLVAWECPRIPEKRFEFLAIKEIQILGEEQTYDIKMRAPGNNFVASGFVVHNSDGMKRYIKELKPTEFKDIIAMVSLYRPGPMANIPSYIARKHGKEPVAYLHPALENSLAETYGIPVYQEQVMQASKDLAGFTGGEADTLRKAMGKKIAALMAEMKVKFLDGCKQKHTIDEDLANKIWKEFEDFAAYGFNKSHAGCYALIAYQTAYLKANYPAAFFAALLTSNADNLDKMAIELDEAKTMGIEVLPPDVNESFPEFGVVREESGIRNQESGGTKTSPPILNPESSILDPSRKEHIRFGLAAIKNVGYGVAEAIVEDRKQNGEYTSLTNLLTRLGPNVLNKRVLEALGMSGALDRWGERNALVQSVDIMTRFLANGKKDTNQVGLFGMETPSLVRDIVLMDVSPAEQRVYLEWEKMLLGIYLTGHPLKAIEGILPHIATRIANISATQEGQNQRVGGMIADLRAITTKTGDQMAFAKLEDPTGTIELVIFPRTWTESKIFCQKDRYIIADGRVDMKDGAPKIIVSRLFELHPEEGIQNIKVALGPLPKASQWKKKDAETKTPEKTVTPTGATVATNARLLMRIPKAVSKKTLEEIRFILEHHAGSIPVFIEAIRGDDLTYAKTKSAITPSRDLILLLKQAGVEVTLEGVTLPDDSPSIATTPLTKEMPEDFMIDVEMSEEAELAAA